MTHEKIWKLSNFLDYCNNKINEKVSNMLCYGCLAKLKWISTSGNVLKCTRKKCRLKQVLFRDKPFYNSKLDLQIILKIIFHLLNGDKIKNITLLYGVDKKHVRLIFKVIGRFIAKYNNNSLIGGDGVIVEIDESKFGRRKYNRGHRVEGSWVVGGVERSAERKIFLDIVEKRDSATLSRLIKRRVHKDSIIFTDSWRGYDGLSQEFLHHTVNHSRHFVDPETGVHTNTIEGTWCSVKLFVKKVYFSSKYLKYYLAIYVFMRNLGNGAYEEIINFFI